MTGNKPLSGAQFKGQLAMFMTGDEIKSQYSPSPGDVYRGETHEDTWERKADEAVQSGLEHSMRTEGVQTPVQLFHGRTGFSPDISSFVANGNHRVAAAAGTDTMIPVLHQETMREVLVGNTTLDQDKNSWWNHQDSQDEMYSDLDDSQAPWNSKQPN